MHGIWHTAVWLALCLRWLAGWLAGWLAVHALAAIAAQFSPAKAMPPRAARSVVATRVLLLQLLAARHYPGAEAQLFTHGDAGSPLPKPIPSIPVPPHACFGKSVDVAAGHDMSGRVVVITGGDTGIGLATSEALASVRATVVIAAYDMKHGAATAANLTRQYSNPNIYALQVRARVCVSSPCP